MFGIGKDPDGRYYDSLAPQFSKGGPKGNSDALRQIETQEYFQEQWVKFLKAQHVDAIRAQILVKFNSPIVIEMLDKATRDLIDEKAELITERSLAENPPVNIVDRKIMTKERVKDEWVRFLSSPDMFEDVKLEAAEKVYYWLGETLKKDIDLIVEEDILRRAKEKAERSAIERATAASRAAVLTNLR